MTEYTYLPSILKEIPRDLGITSIQDPTLLTHLLKENVHLKGGVFNALFLYLPKHVGDYYFGELEYVREIRVFGDGDVLL